MKKIPVESCAKCKCAEEKGLTSIHGYACYPDYSGIPWIENITKHVKNRTIHPDCKLPDETTWQEMDVIPDKRKDHPIDSCEVVIKDKELNFHKIGYYDFVRSTWRVDNYDDHGVSWMQDAIIDNPKNYQWKPIN